MNAQEKMKIGLIGNGHLGQAFTKRFADTNFNADLAISAGRGENAKLAAESDLVVLTVRPLQLAEVVREIRGHLKGGVLTFTAATPQLALEESLNHPVVRAMTDIDFEQILAQPDEKTRGFLTALSQNPLIEDAGEELVDTHTLFVGCLPGVIAWQRLHNREHAVEWLHNYFLFIQARLSVPETVLEKLLYQGLMDKDPAATIERISKPGAITEALLQQLGQKPESTLEEFCAAGWARTHQVRGEVAQSLKALGQLQARQHEL